MLRELPQLLDDDYSVLFSFFRECFMIEAVGLCEIIFYYQERQPFGYRFKQFQVSTKEKILDKKGIKVQECQ